MTEQDIPETLTLSDAAKLFDYPLETLTRWRRDDALFPKPCPEAADRFNTLSIFFFTELKDFEAMPTEELAEHRAKAEKSSVAFYAKIRRGEIPGFDLAAAARLRKANRAARRQTLEEYRADRIAEALEGLKK